MRKQNDQVESLQDNLIKLQNKFTAVQATLNHKNDTIDELRKQIDELQTQHTMTVSELAVLKVSIKAATSKKPIEKLAGIA